MTLPLMASAALHLQPPQANNFPPLNFLTDLKDGYRAGLHKDGRCKASGSCDFMPQIYTLSIYAAYILYITYNNQQDTCTHTHATSIPHRTTAPHPLLRPAPES